MIQFIKTLHNKYRRYKCRKQFNALPKVFKEWYTLMGFDPDSLIKEGKL